VSDITVKGLKCIAKLVYPDADNYSEVRDFWTGKLAVDIHTFKDCSRIRLHADMDAEVELHLIRWYREWLVEARGEYNCTDKIARALLDATESTTTLLEAMWRDCVKGGDA